MAWNFTRTMLRAAIRENLGQKGKNLTDENGLVDRAVRMVIGEMDLRSAKRRQILAPRVTSEDEYTAPTNLKGWGIIDLDRNVNRETRQGSEWLLTTAEEFQRIKKIYPNVIAVHEFDNQRILKISGVVDDNKMVIHSMDGITSNGTWSSDSDNTAANDLDTSSSSEFTGSPHLVYDVDTTGTSATIQNSTMTAVDIRNFKRDGGYIYLRQYIPVTSASERAKITSFRLQIGSDSNNYYQDTATGPASGISFQEGINVLRFNFPTSAAAGTPSDTAIDYVRLALVLSAAFTDEQKGWRTDAIVARQGLIHYLDYYTDFLWDCGNLRAASADSTLLMAYEEEFDLFVEKGTIIGARGIGDKQRRVDATEAYKDLKQAYELRFPSETKELTTYYHYLGDMTEDSRSNINDT